MQVETITMEPEEAQRKLDAYRKALRRRSDEEYEAAAKGYELLADGVALIDLGQVFRDCPVDENGRPRLAVARADRKSVRLTARTDRDWEAKTYFSIGCSFSTEESRYSTAWNGRDLRLSFAWPRRESFNTAYALVPMVPPDVEPRMTILRHRFVLWEVEQWSDRPLTAEPDRDPYLLERLGGDLYAVVGAWDLTDLERAIMALRTEQ